MSKKFPIIKEVEPGTYHWCACGKTKTEPFCDNSHGEMDRQPLEIRVREKKRIAFCNCRLTKTPPLCDGAHLKG